MNRLPAAMENVTGAFAAAFARPTQRRVRMLPTVAILTVGCRTLSSLNALQNRATFDLLKLLAFPVKTGASPGFETTSTVLRTAGELVPMWIVRHCFEVWPS